MPIAEASGGAFHTELFTAIWVTRKQHNQSIVEILADIPTSTWFDECIAYIVKYNTNNNSLKQYAGDDHWQRMTAMRNGGRRRRRRKEPL
ncbi:unnamed protein product, partial [Brenthis ino]